MDFMTIIICMEQYYYPYIYAGYYVYFNFVVMPAETPRASKHTRIGDCWLITNNEREILIGFMEAYEKLNTLIIYKMCFCSPYTSSRISTCLCIHETTKIVFFICNIYKEFLLMLFIYTGGANSSR